MTRRTVAIGVLWLASLGGTVLLARWDPRSPAPVTETTRVIERAGRDRVITTGGLSEAQLRAVIRAELAAATAETPEAPPPEPPPRDDAAFVRADQVVAAAMADGRWTEDDRRA